MTSLAPSPTATSSPPEEQPKATGAGTTLAASLMGFFVIALDALVVTVALPDISSSVSGGMSGLQWVVDGYTLMFAALMLSSGALSDRIGASRAYGIGLALFTAASAACGLAPNLTMLVVARLVQGAAASLMMPASLALVRQAFPDADKRVRAIALWTGAGAVAAAAGPVVGGALTSAIGWRAIFFLNLPVGLIGLALLTRAPRSPRQSAPIDLAGQLTGITALAALTYGVIEGGANGFGSLPVIVTLVVAALSAIVFVIVESKQEKPMMPLNLFRSRTMSVSAAAGFSINAAFYGSIFVLSLFFQQSHGMSAFSMRPDVPADDRGGRDDEPLLRRQADPPLRAADADRDRPGRYGGRPAGPPRRGQRHLPLVMALAVLPVAFMRLPVGPRADGHAHGQRPGRAGRFGRSTS